MNNYEKLEEELKETKAYAKRVIDLWADAKKWKLLAKMTDNDEDYNKYMRLNLIYYKNINPHLKFIYF